jgi:hypothetical protein
LREGTEQNTEEDRGTERGKILVHQPAAPRAFTTIVFVLNGEDTKKPGEQHKKARGLEEGNKEVEGSRIGKKGKQNPGQPTHDHQPCLRVAPPPDQTDEPKQKRRRNQGKEEEKKQQTHRRRK